MPIVGLAAWFGYEPLIVERPERRLRRGHCDELGRSQAGLGLAASMPKRCLPVLAQRTGTASGCEEGEATLGKTWEIPIQA